MAADKPSDKCLTCGKSAFVKERIVADGKVFHSNCFKYGGQSAHRPSLPSLGHRLFPIEGERI